MNSTPLASSPLIRVAMRLIRAGLERRRHLREVEESRLLAAAEQSRRDVERFLMELEERRTWVAYELRERNRLRLVREQNENRLKERFLERLHSEEDHVQQESGVMAYKGAIISFLRWQNSPAKNLDLEGHGDAVLAIKLSECSKYLFSCSSDKTARIWDTQTGICLLVYPRHDSRVMDGDIHPAFQLNDKKACLITCSGSTLNLWCSQHDFPLRQVSAHDEVIYKCSFSREGSTVVTCSEDCTLKLWAFPEAYLLFIYTGHEAPVTCLRFSPSGRYIISGSGYKERKLLLWDANMPKIDRALQLPHVIFWSPEGLIRKICMQKFVPEWTFWLTKQEQLRLKHVKIDTFPGEMEAVVMDSDSEVSSETDLDSKESEDSFDDPFEHPFFSDDNRYVNGARLLILTVDQLGNPKNATEYSPGGFLYFKLQSGYEPISEAFITVSLKDAKFDSFSKLSGERIGNFNPHVLPLWASPIEDLQVDPTVNMYSRDSPSGIKINPAKMCCSYKNEELLDENGDLKEEFASNTIDIVWECPSAFELGSAMVTVNLKLRGSTKWQTLKYSLRESPIRIVNSLADDASVSSASVEQVVINAEGERFLFDQSARHAEFWELIRLKKWEAIDSMLDEKVCPQHKMVD